MKCHYFFIADTVGNLGHNTILSEHPCISENLVYLPTVLLRMPEVLYVMEKLNAGKIMELTIGRLGKITLSHELFRL